jgi:1,4-dihydroxy-2-naphthoate octaprenyltransferase
METTTFTYTKARPILGITIFGCFTICLLVLGILIHEIKFWLFLGLPVVCSICAVIYSIKYRLIPATGPFTGKMLLRYLGTSTMADTCLSKW